MAASQRADVEGQSWTDDEAVKGADGSTVGKACCLLSYSFRLVATSLLARPSALLVEATFRLVTSARSHRLVHTLNN